MKNLHLILIVGILLTGCKTDKQTKESENNDIKKSSIPENIQFLSLDSLTITANLYDHDRASPVIILCHQAGFNKFEYVEIAKTLFNKGFNCIAIDQRSGGNVIESFNETMLAAKKLELSTEYVDAEQDIIAAINYGAEKYGKKVILWGSSYSSTLALYIAIENENIEAVIAFSPGNYLDEQKGSLKEKLVGFKKPMWVTSSKEEAPELTALLDSLSLGENQLQYIPTSDGKHGSKALWKTNENNEEYWEAINEFLKDVTNTSANKK
jgi:pimeloyl-ACP methyl ester carboxylesterase